jgi:hypothetical protein
MGHKTKTKMRYMTFIEETESEYKTKLSLWRNVNNELFIEVQEHANDPDPYSYQCITLDLEDAKELFNELGSIIQQMQPIAITAPVEKGLPLFTKTG